MTRAPALRLSGILLTAAEKQEVVKNCDYLARLLSRPFTAIMEEITKVLKAGTSAVLYPRAEASTN